MALTTIISNTKVKYFKTLLDASNTDLNANPIDESNLSEDYVAISIDASSVNLMDLKTIKTYRRLVKVINNNVVYQPYETVDYEFSQETIDFVNQQPLSSLKTQAFIEQLLLDLNNIEGKIPFGVPLNGWSLEDEWKLNVLPNTDEYI